MKIGILYNSFAHHRMHAEERELRNTARSIGRHLGDLGYETVFFDMDDTASINALCAAQVDAVFDTCERVHNDARGEAYAAALLEYLGIPHTRTSSVTIAFGVNKVRVKRLLAYHRIPSPRFQVFYSADDALDARLRYPLFVKGTASENSIGIDAQSYVTDLAGLRAKVSQVIHKLHQPALVEEFIGGREFSVGILPGEVNRTLPIMEIEFNGLPQSRRFLDYSAKWDAASDQFRHTVPAVPRDLSPQQTEKIKRLALRCFMALGLDSYARVDMRFYEGKLYVLEVNQNPSIDEDGSGYVRACRDVGLDYEGMVAALLHNAIYGAQ